MRHIKVAAGFAMGAMVLIGVVLAIDIYVGGNTYRGTPPLGNWIFGVLVFLPFVLCGCIGFAVSLGMFGGVVRTAQSALLGAGYVVAVGLVRWGLNRFVPFNPFEQTLEFVALVFVVAIAWPFLTRVVAKPSRAS